MPCQGNTAILLPIWIVIYSCLQHGVKHGKKLAADGDQDVHFGFAFTDPALEVRPIAWYRPDSKYGQHPDKLPNIPATGLAHFRMLEPVAPGLKGLRAPSEVRQEFLKCGESLHISNLCNNGCQRCGPSNRKTSWPTRYSVEESSDPFVKVTDS